MRTLLAMMVLVSACGANVDGARLALATATHAVKATDDAFKPIYESAGGEALASSDGWKEFDVKMAPYNRVEAALEAAQQTLLILELSLDAGEADTVLERAGCVADALGELRTALKAVDVDRLPQLSQADAALRALASACRSRE